MSERVRQRDHGAEHPNTPHKSVGWDNKRMPWPVEYFQLEPYKRVEGVEYTVVTHPRGLQEGDR